jgi:putative flavoprotein involved in K+ transport
MAATSKLSARFRGSSPLPPPVDKPCPNVPLIGFHLADGVRAGTIRLRRRISEFTPDGVRFADGMAEPFDRVILATGYRAALGMLSSLIGVDDCGFASRRERVISADRPHLYFVGHNYDASGGLRNIARDARIAASLIARQ